MRLLGPHPEDLGMVQRIVWLSGIHGLTMDIKQFFQPTYGKLLLFLILMGGLNYAYISVIGVTDARVLVGLPYGFWPMGSAMILPGRPSPPTVEFSWINFILDMIFWYLASSVITAVYHYIKGTKASR